MPLPAAEPPPAQGAGKQRLAQEAGRAMESPLCSSKARGHPYSLAAQVIQDSQGVQGFLVPQQLQEIPAGQRSIMPASGVLPDSLSAPGTAGPSPESSGQPHRAGFQVPFPMCSAGCEGAVWGWAGM